MAPDAWVVIEVGCAECRMRPRDEVLVQRLAVAPTEASARAVGESWLRNGNSADWKPRVNGETDEVMPGAHIAFGDGGIEVLPLAAVGVEVGDA